MMIKGRSVHALLISLISLFVIILPANAAREDSEKTDPGATEGNYEIGNGDYRIVFDRKGALLSIQNNLTSHESFRGYAKKPPFKIFCNMSEGLMRHDVAKGVTYTSQTANEYFDRWTPLPVSLVRYSSAKGRTPGVEDAKETIHTLLYESRKKEVTVELTIRVPDKGCYSVWFLKIKNNSTSARMISALFPYLERVGIGPDGLTNDQSYGGGANPYSGKVYGACGISMQFMSRFDRGYNEGLGLIVEDKEAVEKILYNWPGQAKMYVGYPQESVAGGGSRGFPDTLVMAHQGDWHKVADKYREWFLDNFDLTFEMTFEEAQKKGITGVANKYTPRWLYEGGGYMQIDSHHHGRLRAKNLTSLLNRVRKEVGGSVMQLMTFCNKGHLLDPLEGTPEEMKETIRRIHELGGKVIVYMEGWLIKIGDKESKKWQVMNKDGSYLRDHGLPNGCPAVSEWQDWLARGAAYLVREYDADGIYLDSLGATEAWRCYNPAHAHYPRTDVWNRGVLELLGKVKTSIRKEKQDAVLFTEGGIDCYYQYTDGALYSRNYFYNNGEFLRRYTFPRMTLFGRGVPGADGSAVFKRHQEKKQTFGDWIDTVNFQFANGVSLFTHGYAFTYPAITRNWNYTRALFKDALVYGNVSGNYPNSDPGIISRVFKAEDYYLVTLTRLGGTPPSSGRVDLILKGMEGDVDIAHAMKLNIKEFKWDGVRVEKNGKSYNLAVDCKDGEAFAIVLPVEGCRPMVKIGSIPTLKPGEHTEVNISLSGNWSSVASAQVDVEAPGLVINDKGSKVSIAIPATVKVKVPQDSTSMQYLLKIDGKEVMGSEKFVEVLNLSVELLEEKTIIEEDFNSGRLNDEVWKIVTGNDPKARVDIENGVCRIVGVNNEKSRMETRIKVPAIYTLQFDFYQPKNEAKGYQSTIYYRNGRRPVWYMGLNRDNYFLFQANAGGKLKAKFHKGFEPDKWYRVAVKNNAASTKIGIYDKSTTELLTEQVLAHDITGSGRIVFEACSDKRFKGSRGMRIDNVVLKSYTSDGAEYKNGDTLWLKITDSKDFPNYVHAGRRSPANYSIKADFSQLDSNFDPKNVHVLEDVFENKNGTHTVVLKYTITDNNSRPDGVKTIPVTVVDQRNQHPLTIDGCKIVLKNQ